MQNKVENVLLIYASSYVQIPASEIYNPAALAQFSHIYPTCHIYMVGSVPRVTVDRYDLVYGAVEVSYSIHSAERRLVLELPEGSIANLEDGVPIIRLSSGETLYVSESEVVRRIIQHEKAGFNVLYIGQSYGKTGERNALDRLLKHETLQKISLLEKNEDEVIAVTMLEIQDGNSVMTVFSPVESSKDETNRRYALGQEKLYNTSVSERVSIYEAALIRHFMPKYNTIFKNSFPSTNNKSLKDCYDKDFYGISAEICFDEISYPIYSDTIEISKYHVLYYDLQKDESRHLFFFNDTSPT